MTTNHSSLHPFWLILGKFCIFPEPSPSVVAQSIVSSPHKLLRLCSSSMVAHSYVLLPEGLLCLPAQCQECAGNARRQASATSRGCVHCRGAEIHQQYCCLLLCAKRQKRNTAKALQKWPPAGLLYACFCQTSLNRPHRVDGGPMSPHYV